MQNRPRIAVSTYHSATLVMGFVNLLWILTAIWTTMGPFAVLVTAGFIDYLITRLDQYLGRRGA